MHCHLLHSTAGRRVGVLLSRHTTYTEFHRHKPSHMSVRRSSRIANRQEELLDGRDNIDVAATARRPKKSRPTNSSCTIVGVIPEHQEHQQHDKENLPAGKPAIAELQADTKQPLQGSNAAANKTASSTARKTATTTGTRGRKAAGAAASGPTRAAEQALWAQGYKSVAGVDEAGRGPLAGPVVAAAAVLPDDVDFAGLNDSKQMTEEGREELYEQLTNHPDVMWAVAVVGHETIDEINILQAAMLAMQKAVEGLSSTPDHLLIDGNRRPKGLEHLPMQTLVKGDATSSCIAAASVIAKVTRDRLMMELDAQYPQYGFAQHKGYGVPAHKAAIQRHGPCPVHRRSFEPIKSMTGWKGYGQKAAAAAADAQAAAAKAAGIQVDAADKTGQVATAAELACTAADAPTVAAHQDAGAAAQHDQEIQMLEEDMAPQQPAKQRKRSRSVRCAKGTDAEAVAAVQAAGAVAAAGSRRRRRKA